MQGYTQYNILLEIALQWTMNFMDWLNSPQIHKISMNIDDTIVSVKLLVELLLFIAVVCTAYLCKKYFIKEKNSHLIDHLCTCKKKNMCLYIFHWFWFVMNGSDGILDKLRVARKCKIHIDFELFNCFILSKALKSWMCKNKGYDNIWLNQLFLFKYSCWLNIQWKLSSWESEIEKKIGSQTWKKLNGKNQCSWSWGIV